MENEELARVEGKRSVGTAIVVRELYLEGAGGQRLDHGTNLTPVEAGLGQVLGEGHHVQKVYRVVHRCSTLIRWVVDLKSSTTYPACSNLSEIHWFRLLPSCRARVYAWR